MASFRQLVLAILGLALLGAAAGDIESIIAGMEVVAGDIRTVNSTLNTFEPDQIDGVVTAWKIQQQQRQLTEHVKSTMAVVNSTPRLDAQDSATFIKQGELHAQLIKSMLDNIVAHKRAFETAVLRVGDLSKSVRKGMVDGKARTQRFAEAAQGILQEGQQWPEAKIVPSWDPVIALFDQCGGVVCLPPLNLPSR